MAAKKDTAALKWVYAAAGPGRKWVGFLTLVRIAQGSLAVGYAYALKSLVNCASSGDQAGFLPTLGQFVLLVAATVALQTVGRFLHEKAHATLEKVFRLRVFSQLLLRDYAKVSGVHTGEWMNRITSDTAAITGAVIKILPDLCGMLVRLLGAFFALVAIVPQVAFLLLPAGAVMIFLSYFLRSRLKRYHKAVQQADGTARSFLQERLGSLTVIHTFTQEAAAADQAGSHLQELAARRMKRSHFANLSNTALNLAMVTAQVIGIGVCCAGILQGTVTYGTMSAVMYLISLLGAPFAQLSGCLSQYYAMIASAERLMEIENYPLDCQKPPLEQDKILSFYREEFHSLGLEGASFSYEQRDSAQVLSNVSLWVGKGEFVAFTGQSGSGKSTALKILLSLYPLQEGGAYLRTRGKETIPLDSAWRGMFAYVPQGNQLLAGTIRESLTFFDPGQMAREEQITKALQIACADEFIRQLPLGLDTPLGERGSGLSEGQLQRLSIARAILSQRPVLLLDEATSALDAETEEALLKNLRAMTDRTVVIITHRPAALNYCDKVIPFEDHKTGS